MRELNIVLRFRGRDNSWWLSERMQRNFLSWGLFNKLVQEVTFQFDIMLDPLSVLWIISIIFLRGLKRWFKICFSRLLLLWALNKWLCNLRACNLILINEKLNLIINIVIQKFLYTRPRLCSCISKINFFLFIFTLWLEFFRRRLKFLGRIRNLDHSCLICSF